MLDTRIVGSAQLRRIADTIRATGNRGMGRELSAALRKAGGKPVQEAIRREAIATLPTSGGYDTEFSKSLRFRTAVRNAGRTATFRMVTFGDGTKERRDIRSVNKGFVRHPVYGRSRQLKAGGRKTNPWSTTRIEAGFFERGTASVADEAARAVGVVLDDFASRLLKG